MSSAKGSSAGASLSKKGSQGSDSGNDTSSEIGKPQSAAPMSVSSDEINFLVYRYLQESGFVHSAFTFAYESLLNRSNVRNVEKSVPPGALISFLQKGLQYVGIEESLQRDGTGTGRKAKGSKKREREMPTNGEHADFTLLAPRTMSALHRQDPPIRLNVPPATAAAAFKARMDAEAKMDAETTAKVPSKPLESSSTNDARSKSQPSSIPTQQSLADESSFAKSSVAAHTAAVHSAASAMSQLQKVPGPPGTQQRSLDQDIALHQPKNLVGSNSRHGDVVSSQTATAEATLKMVGQVGLPGKTGSNGAQRPTVDASALQLQGGNSNAGFGPLQEALSRLEAKEAKSRKDGTRDEVAPMEVDESTQPRRQDPVHNYVNGMSSRGMDQNGQPVLSADVRHNSAGAQTSSQRQQNFEEDMPIPKSRADEIDQEDLSTRASPDEVLYLRKHSSEVFMCAWNPVFTDLIATGSGDASARIWKMGGSEAKSGFVTTRELPHVTPSADRKNKDVTTLEWSSDGNLLATGSYDGVARVWSRNGALVHTLSKHSGPIFSLKWNKRGDYLLSGSYDQSTIVWDVSGVSGRVVQQFVDHKAPALDVDWKDDTTFASCSTDQRVLICRVGVERALKVYEGHEDEVNAVKWDPSGTLLASCSDDYTAKVWDVASDQKEPLHDFKRHKAEIYTLKWSPTGEGSENPRKSKMLATASFDGSVRLWNVDDGTCIRMLGRHNDSVYSVAFSPSGDYLASGSLAGQLYIWDVLKGVHVKSFKEEGDIFEVAWNVEETRVAACFSSSVVTVIDFKPT